MARRSTRALLPQRETTMLVEGISKKVIKCKARQGFTLGHASVQKGETFFLVRSERRENRYYIVKFNDGRHCYQCSCGCGTCEHEHLRAVREYVMVKVVVPAKGTEATPMTVPATVAEVKARKASVASIIAAKVAEAEKLATTGMVTNETAAKFSTPTPVAKSTDLGTRGNLNTARAFSLFR